MIDHPAYGERQCERGDGGNDKRDDCTDHHAAISLEVGGEAPKGPDRPASLPVCLVNFRQVVSNPHIQQGT
ncbi:hypothetical protein RHSP_26415 [Rhizobium freirei PRF 81]|uniref:Uncharacterized protein n=1 Tax=Rhizobium freirei PRF 81 TaxID=363754 RepID=N6V8I6_9HYPH|nr:hypothetical protein RHSP_26415 [Rhizobium freirei PRF 81]